MSKTKLKPQSKKDIETAIKIIAVCEVIRVIQITIDIICGAAFKRATLKNIEDAKKVSGRANGGTISRRDSQCNSGRERRIGGNNG